MTQSNEIFARNLKHYMDLHEKTQKEMAQIIGVSAPTVHDWLKAKIHPRMDKVELIARYFNVSKADLIEEQTAAPVLLSPAEIGNTVRKSREALNLSQDQLSKKTGISLKNIKQWESGKIVNKPLGEVKALSAVLDISFATLMGAQQSTETIQRQKLITAIDRALSDAYLTDDEIQDLIKYIEFILLKRTR